MSYLTELNAMVSNGDKHGTKAIGVTNVYSALLGHLTSNCVWVGYDAYSSIDNVLVVATKAKWASGTFVSRIDLHVEPIVVTRSAKMFALVQDLCLNRGGGFLERKTIKSDLQIRQSKHVLSAGLRPYDHLLEEKFATRVVEEMREQQRCVTFPLRNLVEKAGAKLSEIVPDVEPVLT